MASSRQGPLMTAGLVIVCGVLGVAAGILGAFTHTWTVVVGGVALIVGLPLALALLAGLMFVVAPRIHPAGPWAAACGWIVTVLVLSWPRAAGDVVIPGTWDGYAFLAVGLVIALAGATRSAGQLVLSRPQAPTARDAAVR